VVDRQSHKFVVIFSSISSGSDSGSGSHATLGVGVTVVSYAFGEVPRKGGEGEDQLIDWVRCHFFYE
jgi:hypothetical protein